MERIATARLTTVLADVLSARPEILEAYLFGSQARGDVGGPSDIDVAVYIDRSTPRNDAFGYVAELTSVVMTALGEDEVDVVVLNDGPPLLYQRVLRDGMRLFARSLPATTTREGLALSRYCDYVPQLRKIDAAHAARMVRGLFGR
jgi:predicted nucleotidyltransferase